MIDVIKKYRTRDGNEVVVLFHYPDNDPDDRIVAHVKTGEGVEAIYYNECGSYLGKGYGEDCRDLVEVKSQEGLIDEIISDTLVLVLRTLQRKGEVSHFRTDLVGDLLKPYFKHVIEEYIEQSENK